MKKMIVALTIIYALYHANLLSVCADVGIDRIDDIPMPEKTVITPVDTTNLMCSTQPVYGNGIYLQVDRSNIGGIPDYKVEAGFSNSPLYIYDENLKLIKAVEFEDCMTNIIFRNGYFYAPKVTYFGNGETPTVKHYKSADGENWTEISDIENRYIARAKDLYNGMAYTWEDTDDSDRIEYLLDSEGMMHTTLKEAVNNSDSSQTSIKTKVIKGYIDATSFAVCVMQKEEQSRSFISLDGVSFVELPQDADVVRMWNDDACLYVGVVDTMDSWYKLSLAQLLDFVKVKYNDSYLSFETPPVMENGRTLVPLRFIFEQMGADVEWENVSQTAIVKNEDATICFSIDNTTATINGVEKVMDVPARLINDKTLVPLRFLSEELGFNVEWDEETQTATIRR